MELEITCVTELSLLSRLAYPQCHSGYFRSHTGLASMTYTLWLIYKWPMWQSFHCNYLNFADDIKFFQVNNDWSDGVKLQEDINSVDQWVNAKLLHLDIKKCPFISLSTRFDLITHHHFITKNVGKVSSIKDLGVILNNKIWFSKYNFIFI